MVNPRLTKNGQWILNGFLLNNAKAKSNVMTPNVGGCNVMLWCYDDDLLPKHWERVCK